MPFILDVSLVGHVLLLSHCCIAWYLLNGVSLKCHCFCFRHSEMSQLSAFPRRLMEEAVVTVLWRCSPDLKLCLHWWVHLSCTNFLSYCIPNDCSGGFAAYASLWTSIGTLMVPMVFLFLSYSSRDITT